MKSLVLQKIETSNILKHFDILLKRWEQTEAIDILDFKIGREMKRYCLLNVFDLATYISRNMDNA